MYGPTNPTDQQTVAKQDTMTGSRLRRASTNRQQGLLLVKLAAYVGNKIGGPINILELGTAAGISGMYMLTGMASRLGGCLVTLEGSHELAAIAERNFRDFVTGNRLDQVNYRIVVGDFDETLQEYLRSLQTPLHLTFIDGNHRKEPTIRYHELIRSAMDERGVIVHDDIAWSEGMSQAWHQIQQMEGVGKTAELLLGNRPSRGLVFLDADPHSNLEVLSLDNAFERYIRQVKRWLVRF